MFSRKNSGLVNTRPAPPEREVSPIEKFPELRSWKFGDLCIPRRFYNITNLNLSKASQYSILILGVTRDKVYIRPTDTEFTFSVDMEYLVQEYVNIADVDRRNSKLFAELSDNKLLVNDSSPEQKVI